MNRIVIVFMSLFSLIINAQSTNNKHLKNNKEMEQKIALLEDKAALKELVDTFSNLADVKDVNAQLLLFTEDAVVESTSQGNTMTLKGRKQIGEAFSAYLSLFDIVYHQNGQQIVKIEGDKALGTSYCQVLLIGKQNNKQMSNTSYVIYNDTYLKINGKWYISHRKSNFVWTKIEEVK